MKFFLDTADIEEIKKFSFLIDGVTTNPTLIAKLQNKKTFQEIIQEISALVSGPISVEVISQDHDKMIQEAESLSSISPNIVVKIPMTLEGLKATKALSRVNIKTNVTLIFSPNQAILAAKCGATYASLFIGRLDDIGHDGMQIVRDTSEIFRIHNIQTEIITASIRSPLHILNAAKAGSHIATVPPSVLAQMAQHKLTDTGLEMFLKDWNTFSRQ